MLDGEEKQEIIIVKRYGGDGEGHHGGAWKIAFADFMTAMMALFLVLWLVNAANEKTKKSVASYFNPVKLVDRTRSSKGLEDSSEKGNKSNSEDKKSGGSDKDTSESAGGDAALFKDPFQVLEQLAQEASEELDQSAFMMEQKNTTAEVPVEDAFVDPFAQAVASSDDVDDENGPEATFESKNIEVGSRMAKTYPDPKQSNEDSKSIEKMEQEQKEPVPAEKSEMVKKELNPVEKQQMAEQKTKLDREAKIKQLKAEIQEEIKERLKEVLGENEQLSESLSIDVTKDGVLISITDQFGFSMFQVGSAVPQGQLVLAMKEISDVLAARNGMVRIYGHTDARPYSGGDYDNWRLSTSRAHSARFMLARGGMEQTRIARVVGFADRKLKEPNSPEAEVNRRIEILLEVN